MQRIIVFGPRGSRPGSSGGVFKKGDSVVGSINRSLSPFLNSRLAFIQAALWLWIISLISCQSPGEAGKDQPALSVPKTERVEKTVLIHGQWVNDPYQWLELQDSHETKDWVRRQCAYTRAWLDALPDCGPIEKRIEKLMDIERIQLPKVRGHRHFFLKRKPGQKQSALYVRDATADSIARILVDPGKIDAEGRVSLDWFYPSWDGRLIAYGLSTGGDEWSVLHVMKVDTGEALSEKIPRARGCSLEWLPDGTGFFYTRYPDPERVAKGQEYYNRHVFFHRLGDDYPDDEKVFGAERDPRELYGVRVTLDGKHLVVYTFGTAHTQIFIRELGVSDGAFTCITEGVEARSTIVWHDGYFYSRTNLDAPNWRVLRARDIRPLDSWEVVVPEGEHALAGMSLIRDRLFVKRLCHACTSLVGYSLDGRDPKEIDLPCIGKATVPLGEVNGDEAFFYFASFLHGPTIFRYDLDSGQSRVHEKVDLAIDTERFETKQVFFESLDKTKVPMFLVHRKGLAMTGDHPCLLTGYGGFNRSMEPNPIKGSALDFVSRGGVWALANIRGGGEYGREWHRAGMLENKQNGFDDFKAAARWLIDNDYTNKDRLALRGSSNGGLLVGAAMVQAPELFRAVVCEIPLLDMIRYHRFSIARLWISEYGSPEDPEQFQWLADYSPYHHVKEGTRYPAAFFITADSDSRVDPMHAMKMTAGVQHATASGHPVLFWMRSDTGHGGASMNKQIRDECDIHLFLLDQLGMPWTE